MSFKIALPGIKLLLRINTLRIIKFLLDPEGVVEEAKGVTGDPMLLPGGGRTCCLRAFGVRFHRTEVFLS